MTAREKLNIDTPEQVALEFSLATVGSRFLALAIDTLIQVAVAAVLLLLALLLAWISSVTIAAAESWVLAGLVLGMFTIYYGYFAVLEVAWNGQTPGKRIIGLRVMHVSGRPISGFEAILRNVVRIVDQMPGIYAIVTLDIHASSSASSSRTAPPATWMTVSIASARKRLPTVASENSSATCSGVSMLSFSRAVTVPLRPLDRST